MWDITHHTQMMNYLNTPWSPWGRESKNIFSCIKSRFDSHFSQHPTQLSHTIFARHPQIIYSIVKDGCMSINSFGLHGSAWALWQVCGYADHDHSQHYIFPTLTSVHHNLKTNRCINPVADRCKCSFKISMFAPRPTYVVWSLPCPSNQFRT